MAEANSARAWRQIPQGGVAGGAGGSGGRILIRCKTNSFSGTYNISGGSPGGPTQGSLSHVDQGRIGLGRCHGSPGTSGQAGSISFISY